MDTKVFNSKAESQRKIRSGCNGVTILEVFVVLAIIAMITALAAPRLLQTFGRATSQAVTRSVGRRSPLMR